MNDEIKYENNPLHGLGLKDLVTEVVDHYGFEILFAYLNLNCFKNKPNIESSVKFLKKTDWAREKVEAFYMYQYKSLPRASDAQFELPPRDRIVPQGQTPGEPAELSLEDAEQLRIIREEKAAMFGKSSGHSGKSSGERGRAGKYSGGQRSGGYSKHRDNDRSSSNSSSGSADDYIDPWAKWRK